MKRINPLIQTDFYKQGHYKMYPEGTTKIYSNLTPRQSRMSGVGSVVSFGLQYFIKEYLLTQWKEGFFDKPWNIVEREYKRMMDHTLGVNAVSVDHIKDLHDLGYLPLEIKALPEGSLVPIRVPLMTITNTVDHAYWLVNFLESILSTSLWQACTSATIANEFFKLLQFYALKTTGDKSFVPWQGHDFSMRGLSSLETVCLSGAAHLATGFTGTDSIPAIQFLEDYYGANVEKELVAGSVPASEHSVISLGSKEGELETFSRILDLFPTGILSMVSDTWSLPHVVTKILPALKGKILAREGKLVTRPDSFWTDPVDCLCGFSGYHPQMDKLDAEEKEMIGKGLIESLWDLFNGSVTTQGYKVLDPHISSIYGDSISINRAQQICERLEVKGFASTNVVLGIGSFTYQLNTRDTFGFAMKATYGEVKGEKREIFKDPITDEGFKKSAKGLLQVSKVDGVYVLKDCASSDEEKNNELKTVFLNGKLLIETTLAEVRSRLAASRT